jgi:isoamylase
VAWLDTTGKRASAAYLSDTSNYFLAWRVDAQLPGERVRSIYVAWNGWTQDLTATLPASASGRAWWVSGDSASGSFVAPGQEMALGGATVDVRARSVAVLVER